MAELTFRRQSLCWTAGEEGGLFEKLSTIFGGNNIVEAATAYALSEIFMDLSQELPKLLCTTDGGCRFTGEITTEHKTDLLDNVVVVTLTITTEVK